MMCISKTTLEKLSEAKHVSWQPTLEVIARIKVPDSFFVIPIMLIKLDQIDFLK